MAVNLEEEQVIVIEAWEWVNTKEKWEKRRERGTW